MKRRMIMTAALTFPVFLLLMQCGRDVRPPEKKNTAVTHDETDGGLKEEYRREGFVSGGVFRVVIVEPGETETSDSIARTSSTARKRAYLSLKKYLIAGERIVTPNVDASLLNLVEREGKLTRVEDSSLTRNVYFYEIRKTDLKGYIDGLAQKR